MKLISTLAALSFLFSPLAQAYECGIHTVTNLQNGTPPSGPLVMAFRNRPEDSTNLQETDKQICLYNFQFTMGACDTLLKRCASNKVTKAGTEGVVGAYLQWATLKTRCYKNCPGFEKVDPLAYAPK